MAREVDPRPAFARARTAAVPGGDPAGRAHRQHERRVPVALWAALVVCGFVSGAAAVLYADPGGNDAVADVSPSILAAASDGTVGADPSATSTPSGATDLNGHHIHGVKALDVAAEQEADQPLDPAARDLLKQQLVIARDVAVRYPTAADAEAAGYHLIAGFGPGSGAHYVGGGYGGSTFDPSRPQSLLYDGTSPTSQIVGLMYLSQSATAPEGFAGPNDHWHRHSSVCTKFVGGKIDVPFAPDADVTAAQCASVGGRFTQTTGWMVHAWVVPSWESPAGVFSHENPNLRCADGTFNTDAVGKCQGS